LALGSTGRIGSLQGMPATPVPTALLAVAAADVELPYDGLAWDFGLELLIEFVEGNIAAAIGTLLGQGSFEG
jgi:hypothetical protein